MADWTVNNRTVSIIDGLLLGDGWISRPTKSGGALLGYASKHQDLAEHVASLLAIPGRQARRYRNNLDTVRWQWVSGYRRDLVDQYHRWRPRDSKEVPGDIRVDRDSVLAWWLGDGCLHRSRGAYKGSRYVTIVPELCSLGFPQPQVEMLACGLSTATGQDWAIQAHRMPSGRTGYGLKLSAKQAVAFFDWLGPCPVPSMEYRWPTVEEAQPKTWNAGRHAGRDTEIRKLRESGLMLREIGERYSLTKERIHQIVRS